MEIQLGGAKGGVAIVSKEDFERVSAIKWTQTKKGYARGNNGEREVKMHGFVMNAEIGQQVDHINGNRLDNQKTNLRVSDSIKNGQNRKILATKTSSKYKGVFYRKEMELYYMKVTLSGKTHFAGYFDSELQAAESYDSFILQNKIDHAPLNFEDRKNELINKVHVPTKERKIKTNEYHGVREYKKDYYMATVKVDGKAIGIKYSKSAEECARAFDKYIVDNNLYEKDLNFPDEYPEYATKLNVRTLCEHYDDKSVKLVMYDDITVLVDKDEYERIKYYKCSAVCDGEYIGFKIDGKNYKLHRFIMNVTDPEIFVDHINNDPFDNRKINLRVSNRKLNPQNKSKVQNTSSKYIGVNYKKAENRWRTTIIKDGKAVLEKKFKEEIDAARWRDLFIMIKLPNDHYKKNFEWTDAEIEQWKKKLNFV